MQGTLNVLADIGISIGMVSIGGRVWQDGRRFGELVSTGLRLRRSLGAISILVITPLLYFMLAKNGASLPYNLLLIGAVLTGLFAQLSLGVLEVVPRLRSDVRPIQTSDLSGPVSRLRGLVPWAFAFFHPGRGAPRGAGGLRHKQGARSAPRRREPCRGRPGGGAVGRRAPPAEASP